MEVIVQSILQNEVQGRVKVACDPNDTIDSLISTFCIEKGIRQKKEYVLKTRDTDILHNTRKISTCGIKTGDTLYLGTPASDEETFGCSNWWILAAVSLIIGSIGLIAISVLKVVGDVIPDEYGIVIDAGSSRTSLFVYHWKGEKENGTGIVRQIGNCRSTAHPFAEYEANPNDAGQTLGNCVEVAKQKIPQHEWSNSLIWFGATAGMRMLRERNNATSNKMMKVVQNTLSKTPFKFSNPTQQAVILSGGQEGAFAWVTVNYLIGSFGKLVKSKSAKTNILLPNKDGETSGSLEMGGASSQITFVPESSTKIPQNYNEKLSLFGKHYEVFAESFLCYGKGEAEKRLLANLLQEKNLPSRLENPCGPKGLIINYTYSYLFEAPCVKGIHALRTYGSEIITGKDIAPNTTYTFEGTGNAAKCYNNTKKKKVPTATLR